MRKLLDFLVRKRHWFLFVLLEIVSLMLIYRNNAYQRNIIFSSANVLTGHIASVSGYVTSYLNLHEINKELLERNGQLEMELLQHIEQEQNFVVWNSFNFILLFFMMLREILKDKSFSLVRQYVVKVPI